uniref:DUF7733 domain-containing protein n=1 Tax=Chaetoceros debilis TaxID=122233 RepID=A0A7S3Q560_9STRA
MTNSTTRTSDSPKITEYSFASEGLAPCAIFALLGYYVHSHSGDAVSNSDLLFSIGFLAYVVVANTIAFENNQLQFNHLKENMIQFEPMGKHSLGRGQFITEKSFLIYFVLSKVLGFLIPLVMIFAAPTEIATMVTPSLVVVIAQAVAEPSTAGCHDVLRMTIPIGYNAYRLYGPLQTWAIDSYGLYLEHATGGSWVYAFNVGLAWVNLVFAAYNLFGFLILRALPLYFDKDETPRVEMAYTLLPIAKKNKSKKV